MRSSAQFCLDGRHPSSVLKKQGCPERTIYYKSTLFDQAGMASLLPPEPPPAVPTFDKRSLPPPMQQAIVDLKAGYPAFTLHEIATICYAQFGRRPSPHTIQLTLASALQPSSKQHRYPAYAAIENPVQKRLAIIRLHVEGWSVKSIAGYLEISRQLVYRTLQRWIKEQFAGLPDKPPVPHHPARHPSPCEICKRSKSSRKTLNWVNIGSVLPWSKWGFT